VWGPEKKDRVSVFASLLLELLNLSESLHFSSVAHLGPISVPLASGCTNSICILTCDIEGLSSGMVGWAALSRPARNTCDCGRDLVSNLLNFIEHPRAALQTRWQPPCFGIYWRAQYLNLNKKYTKLGLHRVFKLVDPFFQPHLPY